ncbi:hypothetical protein ELE36_05260 [Pseudolysobacter antarcticus]|uniref:Trm112 family protein n=1 Tax=Pseudolysobacter antarcticus TaxID=2511995 RepID=A0A411HH58_9GAMM|nr:Trm112 family protein [Pseudolysobacter antarcticus]QBB69823.1 hypothetical protein ELE36_05260 [Pseudolysobacter antarcticus]
MDKRLLDILCCPVSKQPVKPASKAQLDLLNAGIRAGDIQTTAGVGVTQPFTAALITTDGRLIYRVDDDIPVMLADEAIGTIQMQNFPV